MPASIFRVLQNLLLLARIFEFSMIITDTADNFWKHTADVLVNRQKLAEIDMIDRQDLPLNIIQRINH